MVLNMANYDDLLNAAQRRTRTGRSFFPAANYRGINYTLGGQPSPNAINSTPQSQVIIPTSTIGGSRSYRTLPPDQNPAYQAAIAKGRPNMNNYAWVQSPNGGQMRVPIGSLGALIQPGVLPIGSQVTQIGNQLPIDRAAAYAKGYGAPTPTIQPSVSGPVLAQGGVANPVENLTPQARIAGGVGSTLDYLRSNPALTVATNALGGFGRNIARWFGGGNMPSMPPATAAQQPASVPTPNNPSPTPYQTPFPSPTPTETPRRYSDYGYY